MLRKFMMAGSILLLVLCVTGCNKYKEPKEKKQLLTPLSSPVETALATLRNVKKQTVYSAQVVPMKKDLYFDTTGVFGEYKVIIGEKVKKGQELAIQDQANDELEQLENAQKKIVEQYQYEQLKIENQIKELETSPEFEQNKEIYKKQIEIWKEQINLSHQLEELVNLQYKDEIEKATKIRKPHVITAPFDGTIVTTDIIRHGDSIDTMTPILTIVQDNEYYLPCENAKESVIVKALDYYALFEGKKYQIIYESNQIVSETFDKKEVFRFVDDQHPDYGKIGIIILEIEKKDNVLTIPIEAIYKDETGCYVYILDQDNHKERRDIEEGIADSYGVEVISGLKEGDEVYVQN